MTAAVAVDVAGGQTGGAARLRSELYCYLARTGHEGVQIIGAPGGERWTLLRNAPYFFTDKEFLRCGSSLGSYSQRRAPVARLAARRSDVLVALTTNMAERIMRVLPSVRSGTEQNREIASPALFDFTIGDTTSLKHAITCALSTQVVPDLMPFDPDANFNWL
jgi:hypothetical protein